MLKAVSLISISAFFFKWFSRDIIKCIALVIFCFPTKAYCQTHLQIEKISSTDSLYPKVLENEVKIIDSLSKSLNRILTVNIRVPNDDLDYIPPKFIIDSIDKRLLKVIERKLSSYENEVKVRGKNPSIIQQVDTFQTTYFFKKDSLLKVVNSRTSDDYFSEQIFFENDKPVIAFLYAHNNTYKVSNVYFYRDLLDKAKKYITFYKAL